MISDLSQKLFAARHAAANGDGGVKGESSSSADEWKREREELLTAYQASQQSLEKCATQIAVRIQL